MSMLMEAAKEYAKLFDKDYIYTLETGTVLQVYFIPGFFHHLIGLQKLKDIDVVIKRPHNSPAYIFRNILNGKISLETIQKSKFFNEIENRLRHFSQIKHMVEFEKVIVDFEPSRIRSKMGKADYVFFKRSNDNMYLNLFLTGDAKDKNKHIPLTFLAELTDYYTYGQKVIKIVSMNTIERETKRNRAENETTTK